MLSHFIRRICLLSVLILASAAGATSIVFRTFSEPVVLNDRLFVISPNEDRLLALDMDGKPLWTCKTEKIIGHARTNDGRIYFATAHKFHVIDPATGSILETTPLTVPRGSMRLIEPANLLVFQHHDWKIASLLLIDATTNRIFREEPNTESIPYADKDVVVLLKAKRVHAEGGGYTYSHLWLEARRRKNWELLWREKYQDGSDSFKEVYKVGDTFISPDGHSLLAIDSITGAVSRTKGHLTSSEEDSLMTDLRLDQGKPYYVISHSNSADFNKSVHQVRWCSLQDMALESEVSLTAIEVVRVARHGPYLISDALYRTCGFKSDGTKLWEHFQMARTEPIGDRFFFSDHYKGLARVGSIDIPSGRMTVLYQEKL